MHTVDTFLKILDEKIEAKHLLKHPFYQAWSQGLLSEECLQEYAEQYYHHVKAFPTYLSAVHSHTEDPLTRRGLLQNLVEEELGMPNHPDLWKSFALHLGCTEEKLATPTPCQEICALIETFRMICREEGTAEGLAALYAYESQIPAICRSKIDGLKKHYGMHSPEQWRYFSIHIAADEEHAKVERALLTRHVCLAETSRILDAAERVLTRLWDFLSALCHKHQVACSMI